MLRVILVATIIGVLLGCAGPLRTPEPLPASLLHDEWFAPPASLLGPADVFALDDAMRAYLQGRSRALRHAGLARGLVDALYERRELKLDYDASRTRTAAQTFAARAGNCLSLVVMTAALAKELGLQVEYNSAYTEETWSRSGDLLLRSGHINITIGPRAVDRAFGREQRTLTVDFLPPDELRGLRTRSVDEATVVAMFMNNRAAEALARDDADAAYWWARQALAADAGFVGALNTLGVVYQRSGHVAAAERVYRETLQRAPQHTQALSNLLHLLEAQGRSAEARPLAQRLTTLEPEPPYHWFVQGQAALRRGDLRAARAFFAREVARADYAAEFHFWLAVAQFQLGEVEAAREHLQRAQALSTSRDERDLYAAKLAWLDSHRRPQ
ncbi:MAG: tetratricopeptide repeat protein [Ideonella sp.]|nr:tetratricopeptide repeat protein [Ideonella sp.]MCC7459103.1 tetratricopeptide repeat protein [Nitrospira sp.]